LRAAARCFSTTGAVLVANALSGSESPFAA
jgi:hypothetical protein